MIRTVKDFDDMVERALKPPNQTLEKLMALARQRNGGGNAPESKMGMGNQANVPNNTAIRPGGRNI